MTLLNLAWRFIAAVTVTVTGPAAMGQVFHPSADPVNFDPDWQFFAPVDVEALAELSPRKRAPVGFFGTYDRTYLWTSRSETEQSKANGDFGWGNRYDLGYMTDDRSGWLVSFRMMTGPNMYNTTYQERIDRFNEDDIGDPIENPVQPFLDANDPQFGTRAYLLGDSLNVFGLNNFEVNKTWRREPYRMGGIIEPMIGFKYTTLKDFAMNQTYSRSTSDITTPGGAPTTQTQQETLISHETSIKNQMVGGQLGARYFTNLRRWTLSGEFRGFAMANFQNNDYYQRSYITQYSGAPALGVDTIATDFSSGSQLTQSSNQEFVFGFEARAEAAYQVTKAFSLRAGIDVIDFAQGIWRGANPGFGETGLQDQDVQLAGYTFGLSINR
ncbi:hypothetical protein [Aureliella helgolandensis]|nr:hypothetical protein [Aureliella helgolandensis]